MTLNHFHARVGGKTAVFAFAAIGLGAGGLGLAPSANAQQGLNSRSAYQYQDSATGQEFVLDLSGAVPLLKFKNSNEVLALRSSTAQRGDDMLRTDSGALVLRRTELGNIISYMGDKEGAPADVAGQVQPLSAPPMPGSLTDKVKETAASLTRLAGHDVTVFGVGSFSQEGEWAADALANTVAGVKAAHDADAGAVKALTNVRLAPARSPVVMFKDGELVLGVNPAAGYLGRPSSVAIAKAISGK